MVDCDRIETVILDTTEEFMFDSHMTPASINGGECEAFARQVNERLNRELKILSTADIVGCKKEQKPEPWHVWLSDGERHYDAENPQGVESWIELCFWSRIMTSQIEQMKSINKSL